MNRVPRFLACGLLVVAPVCAAAACSPTIGEPPQLGDCIRKGDASCTVAVGGGGGPGVHGEGGEAPDANTATPEDGGSCGEADLVVSSSTQNNACFPCLVGAPSPGSLNCCLSDAVCSGDPGCVAIVQCALTSCNGNAACVGATCEALRTQASIQNYNAFGSCIAQNCSPACPALPQGTTGDL